MHFFPLRSFALSGFCLIRHPHPPLSGGCGCTFLDLIPSADSFLWILGIRIPCFLAVADALFFLPVVCSVRLLSDWASASPASRQLRMHFS